MSETRPDTVSVLLAIAIRLYREELARALRRDRRLRVVGLADSATEALAAVSANRPDVVVIEFGHEGGLDLVRALRAAASPVRTVALAVEETEHDVVEWARAGVTGYVSRTASIRDLRDAVVGATAGRLACSPQVAAMLLHQVARHADVAASAEPHLTDREREIGRLLNDGLANKEIARRLAIGVPTVKNHVHNIIEKLSATGRGEAAARLRAGGYLDAP